MEKSEAIVIIKTGHIAEAMLAYALFKGGHDAVSMRKEIWESEVDEQWTIKINGKEEMRDNIPGLSWFIEFNGWPAGIISVLGEGMMAAGTGANENSLRLALLKHVDG